MDQAQGFRSSSGVHQATDALSHGTINRIGLANIKEGHVYMYTDKTLTCRECGAEFPFTASEQAFYAEKGFQNEPTRCKACRQARKASRPAAGGTREMFDAVCAECGKPTKVPFQPREDRPVYCSECYAARRG